MTDPIRLRNCINEIYSELLDLARDERTLRIQEKLISVSLKKLSNLISDGTGSLDERYFHKLKLIDTRLEELASQHIFKHELKSGSLDIEIIHAFTSTILTQSTSATRLQSAAAVLPEEDTIDQIYERIGKKYGNKTANLVRLQSVLAGTDIVIPHFKGLSEDAVKLFLFQTFPEMEILWDHFLHEGAKPESAYLKEIQIGIVKAFKEHDFPSDEFITPCISEGLPLMVRSTGKEDSVEIANPGGNESLANVLPNKADIKQAIGFVLASYFSEKSMAQRFFSGDDIKVFPPLPVLIQTMVGETEGSIPTSGVLFTRESEHSTQGIVQISASFGHAEGVVTGSSPTDLFYVTDTCIHSIISKKERRKAPKLSGGLEIKDNPKTIQMSPSMDERLCRRLFTCAKQIEAHYGMAMDIEWSYNPKTDALYVFQARPIPIKPATEASYIKGDKINLLNQLQRCHVINSCGAATIEVKVNQALFAKTAQEVLSQYLSLDIKPKLCVIARQTAVNSHEAAFLRSQGVALIYLNQEAFNKAATLIKTHNMLIDTQSSILGFLTPGEDGRDYIELGLKHFIAPHEESLPIHDINHEALDEFLKDLKTEAVGIDLAAFKAELKTLRGFNVFDKILNAIETTGDDQKRAALMLLLATIIEQKILKKVDDSAKNIFISKFLTNLQLAHDALREPRFNAMEKKFAMHWLRSQILDPPSKESIYSDSLMTILERHKEKQILKLEVIEKSTDLEESRFRDLLARSSKFIMNKSRRAKYLFFIKHLDKKELARLAHFFGTIGPANTEVAVNSIFSSIYQTTEVDILAVKKQFIDNLEACFADRALKENIALEKELLVAVESFSSKSLDFGSFELFDQRYEELRVDFMPQVIVCISRLEELSASGASSVSVAISHMLISKVFLQMVSTFDDCIKALTASTEYPKADHKLKLERFIAILQDYQTVTLAAMSDKIIGHDRDLQRQAIMLRDFFPRKLTALIQTCIQTNYPMKMLTPSVDFSVQSASLGSGVMAPNRNPPRSLEDYFTTLHQTLLVCISSNQFTQELRLKIEDLPDDAQALHQKIINLDISLMNEAKKTPTIQTVEWNYPHFKINYNAPLNNHSASFEISGTIKPDGDVRSLYLSGNFFVSLGVYASRDVKLNRYILESYEAGYDPSCEAIFEIKPDLASFSYDVLSHSARSTFSSSCVEISQLVSTMIRYLQKQEPLPDFDQMVQLITKRPSLFRIFKNELRGKGAAKIIDAFLKQVLSHPSIENLRLFIENYEAAWSDPTNFSGDIRNNFYQILERALSDDLFISSLDKDHLIKVTNILDRIHPNYVDWRGTVNPPFSISLERKIKHFISQIMPALEFHDNFSDYGYHLIDFIERYQPVIASSILEEKQGLIVSKSPTLLALIESSEIFSTPEKIHLRNHLKSLAVIREDPIQTMRAIETCNSILREIVLTNLIKDGVYLSFYSMTTILSSDWLCFDMKEHLDAELLNNQDKDPSSSLGQLYLQSLKVAKSSVKDSFVQLRVEVDKLDPQDFYLLVQLLTSLAEGDPSSLKIDQLLEDPIKIASSIRSLLLIKFLKTPNHSQWTRRITYPYRLIKSISLLPSFF